MIKQTPEDNTGGSNPSTSNPELPCISLHPLDVDFLSQVLIILTDRSMKRLNGQLPEHDSWIEQRVEDLIFDIAGLPKYDNPSGREDYGGPEDYCRDWAMDALTEAFHSNNPPENMRKLILRCGEESQYQTTEQREWWEFLVKGNFWSNAHHGYPPEHTWGS